MTLSLTWVVEPGKSELVKRIQATSAVSVLCTLWEALRRSIDALRAQLDMYDLEVWSILHERDMCVASVKELEEVLEAEELRDEEAELGKEKAWYDTKKNVAR